MFKKLFAKREKPKSGGGLLFVCMRESGPIRWESLKDELAKSEVDLDNPDGGIVATAQFPDGMVHLAYMPVPIPDGEVAAQVPYSRFWKAEDSTDHQAHVVLIGSADSPVKSIDYVSRAAFALSTTHDTSAWYCGNASQILNPSIASEFVEGGMSLPIWVNVVCSKNARGGLDASTLGMESLGQREFEIVGSSQAGGALYELLMDLAAYVLDGAILKDRQTFGRTEHERFAIEVGRSKLGKEGTVTRLVWP